MLRVLHDPLPGGVLNIVNGMGPEVGAPLAKSPRIAKIAFTGSTATGRKIMQAATENLIPVTLELGGKSTLGIPLSSPALKKISFSCSSSVKPRDFTTNLISRLRTLYTQ